MRLERALRETRDAGEDLVGGLDPDVPLAALVEHVDELANRRDELAHGAMHAALELFGRQGRKPAFDQIQPRGIGRREMEVEARVAQQPAPDGRALVRARVVQNEVDLQSRWHAGVEASEKRPEFAGAVTGI